MLVIVVLPILGNRISHWALILKFPRKLGSAGALAYAQSSYVQSHINDNTMLGHCRNMIICLRNMSPVNALKY